MMAFMSKSQAQISNTKPKLLLCVCGSIAAYKAAYLVSQASQKGYDVKVVASEAALKFVGMSTFEALSHTGVAHDLYEEGAALEHINLMRWADLILVAPATANFINKIAAGIADDLLSTMFLAHDFQRPYLIAPAMNTQMYLHPTTQASLTKLKSFGVEILETQSGILACQEVGAGKLLDPDLILETVGQRLGAKSPISQGKPRIDQKQPQKQPKILITMGGCVEPIDGVRAITNTSSGATGAYLANQFHQLGADIMCLKGLNSVTPDPLIKTRTYRDFSSLEALLTEELAEGAYDLVIHCAAVSDYSVVSIQPADQSHLAQKTGEKIDSSSLEMMIRLKKNPKLLDQIKSLSGAKKPLLIGFKLTGNDPKDKIDQAIERQFHEANCDLVIHNALADLSSEKTKHSYHIHSRSEGHIDDCVGVGALFEGISLWFAKQWEASQ
jgi:phosphopantothenoylcysteine decarboxylase/phosphopantothenate--cysteine ligase